MIDGSWAVEVSGSERIYYLFQQNGLKILVSAEMWRRKKFGNLRVTKKVKKNRICLKESGESLIALTLIRKGDF